jgi:hypothetical protein
MKKLYNPLYLYILSFVSVMLIYQFGWSALYPVLTKSLIIFFAITFIVAFIAGFALEKLRPLKYISINSGLNPLYIISGLYLLLILEFVIYKGIPVVQIFAGNYDKSNHFGIKTLHPLLVTFSSFYCVYTFHQFLSLKERKYILFLILLLLIPLLYFDRGALLIVLTSMTFVYFMSVDRLRLKAIAVFTVFLLLLLFGFGVLGNLRESKSSSNNQFLITSKASEKFRESAIPKEFLWSYMYITSPLANLQNNINVNENKVKKLSSFLLTELMPDFVSKRIAPVFNAERAELKNISPDFTVGTIYARPYVLMRWSGVYAIFILNALFMLAYMFVLKSDSPYCVTGVSILCAYSIYNAFTNMIYFSGMSFQLIYPLVLGYVFKKNRL